MYILFPIIPVINWHYNHFDSFCNLALIVTEMLSINCKNVYALLVLLGSLLGDHSHHDCNGKWALFCRIIFYYIVLYYIIFIILYYIILYCIVLYYIILYYIILYYIILYYIILYYIILYYIILYYIILYYIVLYYIILYYIIWEVEFFLSAAGTWEHLGCFLFFCCHHVDFILFSLRFISTRLLGEKKI